MDIIQTLSKPRQTARMSHQKEQRVLTGVRQRPEQNLVGRWEQALSGVVARACMPVATVNGALRV